MIINKPAAQQSQVLNNTLAIPVGTNTVFAYDKFLWKSRDLNCTSCKNGMKSMIVKRINDKSYNIPVVCTCVPYMESTDDEGVSIVVLKGRRERWVKGKRPENYIVDESVRSQANRAAQNTKAMVSGQNEVRGQKFQIVKNQHSEIVPKSEFLSKSLPGMTIKRAPEIPTESAVADPNVRFGDVTKDSLPPETKGPQKTLHTLSSGARVFVDDKTFRKLSGQPLKKSVSDKAVPAQPTGKKRGRPAKASEPAAVLTESAALAAAVGSPKVTVAALAAEPEKKKRGRPKKTTN